MGQLDDGGVPSVGHRRWILYPYRKVYGHGSTPGAMALWALGGRDMNYPEELTDRFDSQFVAWPPAGFVPSPLACAYWSFSFNNSDFSTATVEMTENGRNIECELLEQEFGYGQNTLVWYVNDLRYGYTAETKYQVNLKHVRILDYDADTESYRDFSYTVTFIPISTY
jgi:hypothetical protein